MKKVPAYLLALLLLCGCSGANSPTSGDSGSSGADNSQAASESTTSSESTTAQNAAGTTSADSSATEVTEPEPPAEETDPSAFAQEQLGYTRAVITDNFSIVGAAYIGYVYDEQSVAEIADYLKNSETYRVYCYLDDAQVVLHEGSELYAIIPLEDYSITVYPSVLTEECENVADRTSPLYQGKPGESVALRCNYSEIFSNVLVSVSNGTDTLEFQPMLSMRDGHMVTPDRCHDLSIYDFAWEGFESYAYESLAGNLEIHDLIEQGMTLRCTEEIVDISEEEQGLVFALGTDREDQFVNERFYAVGVESGINYALDPVTGEWGYLHEG